MNVEEGDWVLVDMDKWRRKANQPTKYLDYDYIRGKVYDKKRDGFYTPTNSPLYIFRVEVDESYGFDYNSTLVLRDTGDMLQKTNPECLECKSQKVYSERRQDWYCPFCKND